MRHHGAILVIVLAAIGLCAVGAWGDVVYLKGGGKMEGLLLENRPDALVIQLGTGTITLPVGMVERIEAAPSPRQQYQEKLAGMSKTAAGHIEMARWCEQKSLVNEAREHYFQAIQVDPDNAAARSALGFIRVGDRWMTREEARQARDEPRDAPAAADPTFPSRRDQWRTRLGDMSRKSFGGWAYGDEFQKARRDIVAIKDPAAVEPIMSLFAAHPDANRRQMAVEALGSIGGDQAATSLVRILARDPDQDVATQARAALANIKSDKAVALMSSMARSAAPLVRARIGMALADAGAVQPDYILQLINSLITRDEKIIHHVPTESQRSWFMTGTTYAYVADLTPVVAEAAVAWDPVIAYIVDGAILDVKATIMPWEEHIWITNVHPDVLGELRRLTGQDLGYDIRAWRDWYYGAYLPAQRKAAATAAATPAGESK